MVNSPIRTESDVRPRPSRRWFAYFLFWTTLGLVSSLQYYFAWWAEGESLEWTHALSRRVPGWWLWGVMAIGISVLARRYPIGRRVRRGAWIHIPVGIVVALVHEALRLPIEFMPDYMAREHVIKEGIGYFDIYWVAVMLFSLPAITVYFAIVAVFSAVFYRERLREKEVQAATLEGQLSEARLAALKMQLQPHFLFNTLHSVAALARSGRGQEVVRVVSGLSDLLRRVLAGGGSQLVSLAEELDFVDQYLEIEGLRFEDRLRVRRDVPAELLDEDVPNLILQPLVENAVRHGISVRPQAGRILVRAERQPGHLVLEVIDDGPGPGGPAAHGGGIGLANVRQRLQELYGDAATFSLRAYRWPDDASMGSCARIEIPSRPRGGQA